MLVAMQLFSFNPATLQLREAVLDCQLSLSTEGQHVLRCIGDAVVAWISNVITTDFLLLATFCAGFCLFRTISTQHLLQRIAGKFSISSDKACQQKISHSETISTSAVHESITDSKKCSEPRRRHGHDYGHRRPRSCTLEAQTAGQKPELPQECTTVVLWHIPKTASPDDLLADLHESGYFGEIDFIYVPFDFKHGGRSLGFAMLNFHRSAVCLQFASEFHLAGACDKLTHGSARKLLEVSPAGNQGLQENVRRLQKSHVISHLICHPTWLPRVVDRGGLTMPLKARRRRSRSQRLMSSESV